jgi:hypothetical protein
VLVALAPEKRRWLRHHPLELAIVVLTPPLAPAPLQAARFFRLLLVVRGLAAASAVGAMLSLEGLRYATLLALIRHGDGQHVVAYQPRGGGEPGKAAEVVARDDVGAASARIGADRLAVGGRDGDDQRNDRRGDRQRGA